MGHCGPLWAQHSVLAALYATPPCDPSIYVTPPLCDPSIYVTLLYVTSARAQTRANICSRYCTSEHVALCARCKENGHHEGRLRVHSRRGGRGSTACLNHGYGFTSQGPRTSGSTSQGPRTSGSTYVRVHYGSTTWYRPPLRVGEPGRSGKPRIAGRL